MLAAFVVALAAFVVAFATLVLMGASFVLMSAALMLAFAAGSLTGLCFAAILGASVHAGLAIVGGAGSVLAGALVMAVMLADHRGVDGAVCTLLSGIVVAAGGHTESKSDSGNSG